MNERIRQLAEQADIGFYWDSPSIYAPVGEPPVEQALITPEELAKFAELIIRECIDILEPKSRYMGEGPEVLKDKISQINKHFGVEE